MHEMSWRKRGEHCKVWRMSAIQVCDEDESIEMECKGQGEQNDSCRLKNSHRARNTSSQQFVLCCSLTRGPFRLESSSKVDGVNAGIYVGLVPFPWASLRLSILVLATTKLLRTPITFKVWRWQRYPIDNFFLSVCFYCRNVFQKLAVEPLCLGRRDLGCDMVYC